MYKYIKYLVILSVVFLSSSSAHAYVSFDNAKVIFKKLSAGKIKLGIYYKDSWDVNASYRLGAIYLYKGILHFVRNEDELALIIAHEMAHYQLGHWHSTPENEYQADLLGAAIASKAGYNVCVGAAAMGRLNDPGGKTHPPSAERYRRLTSRC